MTGLGKGTTALTLLAVLAAQLTACSGGGSSGAARVSSPVDWLTDAEWDYGASFTRDVDDVTFQPEVVIPGGGADAVVGATGDGLTWIIDGDAAEVDDLEPGKVMLATNRAAGRVLAVEEADGGNLAVTLGPIELTDAIRDIDTSYEGAIDPDLIQVRTAPGLPSTADVTNRDPVPGAEPAEVTASATAAVPFRSAAPAPAALAQQPDRGALPPPSPSPTRVETITGMRVIPLHGSDGTWGVELAYDRNGLKVVGQAKVYLEQPRVIFDLRIANGRIERALAELRGVAGVRATFSATSEQGIRANINQVVDVPVDLNVPVFGPSLPFSANFHQTFQLATVFSAKQSVITFDGAYVFEGSLRAGYENNRFTLGSPTNLRVDRSLIQSTKGKSIGVTGFLIGHKLQLTVGIGGWGFVVGPYVSLNTAMTVTNGSDLGIVKCKGATLNLDLGYGIGYVMPKAFTDVLNLFLNALNLGQVQASGGTKPALVHLKTLEGYWPKIKACDGAI